MTHEDHVAIGGIDRAFRHRDVACETDRGILNDENVIAIAFENVVDPFPAGTVNKSTVNEDDIFFSARLTRGYLLLRRASERSCG